MAGIDKHTSTDHDGLPCQFGKYELLRKIGAGGMAEVFKAKLTGEHGFEKLVAIKRILPHLSRNPDFLSMFMEEARLAALLSHQNIVQIFDFGNVDGTYFISMEYLQGSNLRTILRKAGAGPAAVGRRLPLECSLTIVSRICAALEYAHNLRDISGAPLGIIHCDINPQNILITTLGEVKVLDFGIARISARESGEGSETLQGKIRYMSPEQACCHALDRRSDIFSIGVLLYEMVTGEQAFKGDARDAFQRVRRAEYPPPEQLFPGLPQAVAGILHTAMARDPDARFQTCAEMYARLDHCMASGFERLSAEKLARHIRLMMRSDAASAEPAGKERRETLLGFLNRLEPGPMGWTRTRKLPAADSRAPGVLPPGAGSRLWRKLRPAAALILASALAVLFVLYPSPTSRRPHWDQIEGALQAVEDRSFGKALLLFERLLAREPGILGEVAAPYAETLLREGARLGRSHPRAGIQLIEKCIEVDPSNARAHFELGKLHTRRQDYPSAVAHYRKAIALDAGSAKAFFNLGYVYARTADFARAEEMYRRTVELTPPFVDEAWFNLAMVQKRLGKTRESIRSLERAVAANPLNKLATEYLERFTRGS
jgi:serine/threonine protein kinase